jgi:nucleotide-binding universal stress UspA family protein
LFERAETIVKRRLQEVVKRLAEDGVKAEAVVSFGPVAEEIVREAERRGCDLIAMSTHGRTPLGRGILGSVTDKVIHSSHLPTLAITPERAKAHWQDGVIMSRIMVPLDGSALAETALPYVEELAQRLSLEIILARAISIGGFYSAHLDGYPYADYTALETESESDAVGYLEGVAGRLRAKGLEVSWKVLKGSPARSLVELAHEIPQDIIVLTTHGRSGLSRWIVGSVAEAVVRASGDPVVVIPPTEAAEG